MAGFPLTSISQTFTVPVSGTSGAFDLTQFDRVTVGYVATAFTGSPTDAVYLEAQNLDGTWITHQLVPQTKLAGGETTIETPFNTGRISYDFGGSGTITVSISVFGLETE
jgi:hypothetical protein